MATLTTVTSRRARHSAALGAQHEFPRALLWAPLAAVLITQAILSARLIHVSVASGDESLYIYSGHQLIHELWHGGGTPYYETYFSGAPDLYPVLAGIADHLGGLAAVRLMSLACMLTATGLLYATADRIFGYWPAVTAAALFASLGVTQFLGAYATFDAMALMLMAAATYCALRAAEDRAGAARWVLVIPAVLLTANAIKYASALFDPVVIGLGALMIRDNGWKRAAQRAVALSGTTLLLLVVAVFLAGSGYLKGILETTLTRQSGSVGPLVGLTSSTPGQIISHSWNWIGLVICLGVLALLTAVPLRRERRHLVVLLLLDVAGILVTLEYLRLDTLISAEKHDDFGAWFTCIAGGYALARGAELVRRWYARIPFIIVAASATGAAVFLYLPQAAGFFSGNAIVPQALVLRPYLASSSRHYLLLGGQEPMAIPYYLHLNIPWQNLTDDNYIKYPVPGRRGTYMEGVPGFEAAIHHRYFAVVSFPAAALNTSWDQMELRTVRSTPGYKLVSTVGGPTYIYPPDFSASASRRRMSTASRAGSRAARLSPTSPSDTPRAPWGRGL